MFSKTIAQNYTQIAQCIAAESFQSGRAADATRLLAVSKTQSVDKVMAAYAAGARDFGENYVQEGVEKVEAFERLAPDASDVVWHFIGPLQSNKTRLVAAYFDWVHSVDRLKIAQRLSEQRPAARAPLNVCIQVNIDAQSSKSGCAPEDALSLALQIAALPNVRLRGLMAIPAALNPNASAAEQRAPFEALAQLFAQIQVQLPPEQACHFDTVSMGMSDDYPQAIAAGSTMVRIGTAIFGARG